MATNTNILNNDYTFKERLGQGTFGEVFRVTSKTKPHLKLVIKIIPTSLLSEFEKLEAKQEASILSLFESPYITKYYESFIDSNNLYIIMEYCDGGDLKKYIKRHEKNKTHYIPEDKIWKMFIEICLGLNELHTRNILHRDLKTMNIFLTADERIKLGDLGVAKVLDNTEFARTFVGAPYYLSPEICAEKPYNTKSDIWSLGCILYELMTFTLPFTSKNMGGLFLKIMKGKYPSLPKVYSKEIRKLNSILLEKNPYKRPSVRDILHLNTLRSVSKVISMERTICNTLEKIDKDVIEKNKYKENNNNNNNNDSSRKNTSNKGASTKPTSSNNTKKNNVNFKDNVSNFVGGRLIPVNKNLLYKKKNNSNKNTNSSSLYNNVQSKIDTGRPMSKYGNRKDINSSNNTQNSNSNSIKFDTKQDIVNDILNDNNNEYININENNYDNNDYYFNLFNSEDYLTNKEEIKENIKRLLSSKQGINSNNKDNQIITIDTSSNCFKNTVEFLNDDLLATQFIKGLLERTNIDTISELKIKLTANEIGDDVLEDILNNDFTYEYDSNSNTNNLKLTATLGTDKSLNENINNINIETKQQFNAQKSSFYICNNSEDINDNKDKKDIVLLNTSKDNSIDKGFIQTFNQSNFIDVELPDPKIINNSTDVYEEMSNGNKNYNNNNKEEICIINNFNNVSAENNSNDKDQSNLLDAFIDNTCSIPVTNDENSKDINQLDLDTNSKNEFDKDLKCTKSINEDTKIEKKYTNYVKKYDNFVNDLKDILGDDGFGEIMNYYKNIKEESKDNKGKNSKSNIPINTDVYDQLYDKIESLFRKKIKLNFANSVSKFGFGLKNKRKDEEKSNCFNTNSGFNSNCNDNVSNKEELVNTNSKSIISENDILNRMSSVSNLTI